MEVDGGKPGVLELRECCFGVTKIIVQSGGIKELDIVITG